MLQTQHSLLFRDALESIRGKKVAVIGHVRPDGDCIGSQVALCKLLLNINIEAIAVNAHPPPKILQPFTSDIAFYKPSELHLQNFVPITVDCAELSRMGEELSIAYPKPFLNIDHHLSNTYYATHNIVEGSAAATAELLCELFLAQGVNIDAISAQALFLGLCTDTGQFMYSSVTPRTFELASYMVKCGAIPNKVAVTLFQQEEFSKIALLRRFLDSMHLECEGYLCIGVLTSQDYLETNTKPEQSEGFVDFTRSIASVVIGAFIEVNQENGTLKISLRAKEPKYRLDLLAKKFNGGGHACAAGLNLKEPYSVFYPQFLQAAKEHLNNIVLGE